MSTKKKNRGKKPVRLCVCCGAEKAKSEMLRVVTSGRDSDETEASVDMTGKAHGRGAYICKTEKCIRDSYDKGLITEEIMEECLNELSRSRLQLIAIAMKAGKIASGEFQCEESVKSRTAKYVVVAEDASDNTKDKFKSKCEYYRIPFRVFGTREELGHIIGKSDRATIAFTDEALSDQFSKLFGGNE